MRRSGRDPELLARNTMGQAALWKYGISGDLPLLLVRITEERDLALVRQVLKAHEFWRLKGLSADVVLLNEHSTGYRDEIHQALTALLEAGSWSAWKQKPGGIFLLRSDAMGEDDRIHLAAASQAVLLRASGGSPKPVPPAAFGAALAGEAGAVEFSGDAAPPPRSRSGAAELALWNGLGGFTRDGREYVVVLDGDRETPLPWVNVIANPGFGTVVTPPEPRSPGRRTAARTGSPPLPMIPSPIRRRRRSISGTTRMGGSGRRLRSAPPSRSLREVGGPHGAGHSSFEHSVHGIAQELRIFVHSDDPVKFSLLTLENLSGVPRRLSLSFTTNGCWDLPGRGTPSMP